MDRLRPYFPEIPESGREKFSRLVDLFNEWNSRINLVSRKDSEFLWERHILHSLSIARYYRFRPGTRILDIGTGGGFPGLPLAIIFPACSFTLVDSIAKKIRVVGTLAGTLRLDNVRAINCRAEDLQERFHFIASRAVTSFPEFVKRFGKLVSPGENDGLENGILYLKGGDLEQELGPYFNRATIHDLSLDFKEAFYETKKLIYLPRSRF